MAPEPWVSTTEAAKRMQVARQTVLRWADSGVIRCVRLPSGRIRVPVSEIERLLVADFQPKPVSA